MVLDLRIGRSFAYDLALSGSNRLGPPPRAARPVIQSGRRCQRILRTLSGSILRALAGTSGPHAPAQVADATERRRPGGWARCWPHCAVSAPGCANELSVLCIETFAQHRMARAAGTGTVNHVFVGRSALCP